MSVAGLPPHSDRPVQASRYPPRRHPGGSPMRRAPTRLRVQPRPPPGCHLRGPAIVAPRCGTSTDPPPAGHESRRGLDSRSLARIRSKLHLQPESAELARSGVYTASELANSVSQSIQTSTWFGLDGAPAIILDGQRRPAIGRVQCDVARARTAVLDHVRNCFADGPCKS